VGYSAGGNGGEGWPNEEKDGKDEGGYLKEGESDSCAEKEERRETGDRGEGDEWSHTAYEG
jgi:hypothetical protein